MVSVNPDAIRFFKHPNGAYREVNQYEGRQEKMQTQKHDSSADSTPSAMPAETELLAKMSEQREAEQPEASGPEETMPPFTSAPNIQLTSFYLPLYASPWLLIPAYLEVSFASCLAIYVHRMQDEVKPDINHIVVLRRSQFCASFLGSHFFVCWANYVFGGQQFGSTSWSKTHPRRQIAITTDRNKFVN